MVVCRVVKFGCARHCVIYMNQLLAIFSCLYVAQKLLSWFKSKSCFRCPTVLLSYISNFKRIGPAFPEIRGSKGCPNFFVFPSSLQQLINPFKNNLPLLLNSTKFAPSIMLYNAYFALKFGYIWASYSWWSIKNFENILSRSQVKWVVLSSWKVKIRQAFTYY